MIDSDRVRTYHALREAGRKVQGRVLNAVPRSVVTSTARELGLWKKGMLVADESDIDVLADRMIYDKRWESRSCVEHFEDGLVGADLTESEGRYLQAMKTVRFSLFTIVEICPGSHAVVSDRLMELHTGHAQPPVELIDLGLSETGIPGARLATRLLDAGGFFMTTGVSFPFAADREAAIMTYLREKEPGFGRRRLDLPEDYSLFFYRLHRRFGIAVSYESRDDEEEG